MVPVPQMIERVALPQEHQDLVCRFLRVFSRFEASLKSAGYARQDGDRLIVEWRRFALEAGAQIQLPVVQLEVLVRNPPGRQRVLNHQLEFVAEQVPAEARADWVLEMVYRVRNNLFHGGKWPPRPERDGPLLQSRLVALGFFVDLDQRVRQAYFAE